MIYYKEQFNINYLTFTLQMISGNTIVVSVSKNEILIVFVEVGTVEISIADR